MSDVEITEDCVPIEQAIERIRRSRRRRVFLQVGMFAPFTIQNPAKPERKLGTVGGSSIAVTRQEAVKFLLDAFPEHWRRKLCLRICTTQNCLFVGSAPQ